MYGWLASRKTTSVIVNEFVLRRTREIKQWDMGIRHMNASSNAYRYYIMRNRGHMKNYYRSLGVYNPVLFGAGTALTFGKELIRLLVVEHTVRGTSNLFRGHPRRSQDRERCVVEADAAAGGARPSEISPRCNPRCSDRALRRSGHPLRARPCRGTARACRSGAGPSRCG